MEFGEMMNDLVDFLHPSHKATTMPEQDYITERYLYRLRRSRI